jgi:AraC-like DNA-binding protein
MSNVNDSLVRWSQWVLAPSGERPPSALAKNVFRSADADETRAAIARVYCEHELDVVGDFQRLDAALAAWDLGEVAIGYMRHGAEVIIRPGQLGWYYGVDVPVKGSAISWCDRSEAGSEPGSAVILSPTQDIVMRRSADCEQLALRIGRRTLERELSRLLRRGIDAPVVFDPRMDLSARAVSGWAATLGFVLDEIRRGTGSLDHPLVRSRVEQLLIDQLLVAQRHTFSEELQTGHRPARPPTVRRAVEIIQDRAADPLTVPMLAGLAGVSVRGLQQGFRDYLGITPLEYLREVRLARARDDLLAADPEADVSVTEVAYRWGFGHLARFAGYYRHRYGELPSETLRRR